MTHTIQSEPIPVYTTIHISRPKRVDVCQPSPHTEALVNQLKSALVEAYKMDGRRVKVLIVERG